MQTVPILSSFAAEKLDDNIPNHMNSVFEGDRLHISHSENHLDRHPSVIPDFFIPDNLDEGKDA